MLCLRCHKYAKYFSILNGVKIEIMHSIAQVLSSPGNKASRGMSECLSDVLTRSNLFLETLSQWWTALFGFGRMTGTSSHWKPIPTADSQSTHQAATRTRYAKMKHGHQLFQSLSSESISACLCLSISYLTLQLGLSQMNEWMNEYVYLYSAS